MKLKEFAKQKGGVNQLAMITNITQTQLSQYISGTREPGKAILEKIKKAGCDMNWLLNNDDASPAVVRESNVDYKLITEVEALSKELAKLKEEVTALKEMHSDQALLIHSLKKENESLTEENRVLRVQSESITAAHVKIDVEKNNKLKAK